MTGRNSPPLKYVADIANECTRPRRHVEPFIINENLQPRYFVLNTIMQKSKRIVYYLDCDLMILEGIPSLVDSCV